MQGQSVMAAIVIAVVLIIVLMMFLVNNLAPSETVKNLKAEYQRLYVNNLLITILNTETECGSFSEMLKTAYFGSGKCGRDEFGKRLPTYMDAALLLTGYTNYDWMLEVTSKGPGGITKVWGSTQEDITETPGYLDATTMITRSGSPLDVKLYIRQS